ncbi:MAG TPA: hypothetical protein VN514_07495 [Ignavibacteria bacterium]|nr:hypothetical protein [Ignavibacteria bacterium]
MKKFYILVFLLTICSQAFSIEIKGRLIDERYFPVPNISVVSSKGGGDKTDKNGNFTLNVESFPVDIIFYDYSGNTGNIYRNVNTQNPEIIFFGLKASRNINTEIMKVEFPPIGPGRSAIVKYISDDVFDCDDVFASSGERMKVLTILFPAHKTRLNGKVIYLEKTAASFEKYYEYSITVIKEGYPQTVVFDSMSYSTNPGEAYVNVYPPAFAYDTKGFSVYADFLSLHRNAEITLNTSDGDIISSKVIVPQTLPYAYRLKIEGRAGYKKGERFVSYTYSYPGSSLNISTETAPKLDAPQDKYWGVSNNTQFSWDWGSGTGIYVAHFHAFSPSGDFYVVTRDRSVTFPKGISGGMLDGNEYSWEVSKYLTYTSVDDFIKVRQFSNDLAYKAILTSELRTFRINAF